jgi:hypothetical protein
MPSVVHLRTLATPKTYIPCVKQTPWHVIDSRFSPKRFLVHKKAPSDGFKDHLNLVRCSLRSTRNDVAPFPPRNTCCAQRRQALRFLEFAFAAEGFYKEFESLLLCLMANITLLCSSISASKGFLYPYFYFQFRWNSNLC